MNHIELARLLDARRNTIVDEVAALILRDPFFQERFPHVDGKRAQIDTDANFAAVIKAVRYRSPMIFDDHMVWRRRMLLAYNCSTGLVRQSMAHMWTVTAAHVDEDAKPLLDAAFVSALQALLYRHPQLERIADDHDRIAEELATACYDAHWDWQTAYQTSGRAQMYLDAWWCIDYLIDAVGFNNPQLWGNHLVWMRQRARERGLATVHIQQLVWFLADLLTQRLGEGAAEVRQTLEAGLLFLDYPDAACRALLEAQDAIIAHVAAQLVEHNLAKRPEYAAFEAGWYVSYLYDCLATGDATSLVNYTEWMRRGFELLGRPSDAISLIFTALQQAVTQHLPADTAQQAIEIIHASGQTVPPTDAAYASF